MRVAVISDIHANSTALECVLQTIDQLQVDQCWCLGDVVGYGPAPQTCVDLVRSHTDLCLAGNHDLALLGSLPLADFNPWAAQAIRWQRQNLSGDALAWLQSLQPIRQREDITLVHGSPVQPAWEYIHDVRSARSAFSHSQSALCLFGHTHIAEAWQQSDGRKQRIRAVLALPGESLALADGQRWLLNPGSVGQPRDGDPRASFAVLDIDAGAWTWHRLEYDIDEVLAAIAQAGLPEMLGRRLYLGW